MLVLFSGLVGSRYSRVGVIAGRLCFGISAGARNVSLLQIIHIGCGSHPWVPELFSLVEKMSQRRVAF